MAPVNIPGRVQAVIDIDLCFSCQGIWFDSFESLQIAPDGIIQLFKLLRAHRDDPRQPRGGEMSCPRCGKVLAATRDLVKSGHFNYHRCPGGHGRFVGFSQFMIEKGFVRQLTGAEITALQARIGVIHCGSCGAPVDIRTEDACSHCGSPSAILEPEAEDKALQGDQQAEQTRHDPESIAETIFAAESSRSRPSFAGIDTPLVGDLILSGLDLISGLFDP